VRKGESYLNNYVWTDDGGIPNGEDYGGKE
jgi:hypothetical protein